MSNDRFIPHGLGGQTHPSAGSGQALICEGFSEDKIKAHVKTSCKGKIHTNDFADSLTLLHFLLT